MKSRRRSGEGARLGIGEVARRAGISASAIRYYEAEGLLPPAGRVNGRRVYGPAVALQLAWIELAKEAGFSLPEIRRLRTGFADATPVGARWRALADRKRRELDRRIAEAERMKRTLDAVARCACETFDDCARAFQSRAESPGGA